VLLISITLWYFPHRYSSYSNWILIMRLKFQAWWIVYQICQKIAYSTEIQCVRQWFCSQNLSVSPRSFTSPVVRTSVLVPVFFTSPLFRTSVLVSGVFTSPVFRTLGQKKIYVCHRP
jgi:uncharacterized membrane protein